MYIEFRTKRLEKCYKESGKAQATWDEAIAEKYIEAIKMLKAVNHPSHLGKFPQLHYEPLKADRKGQHSLRLGERARLIFTVRWDGKVATARIMEVSTRHYGR